MPKILGNSKIQPNYRITLIKVIRKRLDVDEGDIIIFIEDEKGDIVIKKGELKPI